MHKYVYHAKGRHILVDTQVDNIWDFYVRVCADGSPMKIDVDFDQSH